MSAREGWSKAHSPKALRDVSIDTGTLQRLQDAGLASRQRCYYKSRRYRVAIPDLSPGNVAELKAQLESIGRLSTKTLGKISVDGDEVVFENVRVHRNRSGVLGFIGVHPDSPDAGTFAVHKDALQDPNWKKP